MYLYNVNPIARSPFPSLSLFLSLSLSSLSLLSPLWIHWDGAVWPPRAFIVHTTIRNPLTMGRPYEKGPGYAENRKKSPNLYKGDSCDLGPFLETVSNNLSIINYLN